MQIFTQSILLNKNIANNTVNNYWHKKKKNLRKCDFRKYVQVRFRNCNFKICQKNIMKIRKWKNIKKKGTIMYFTYVRFRNCNNHGWIC